MEVVAAAPRCQLLLIVLMAAMLLPEMKGSLLLVWRKIAKTIKLQGSIGKVIDGSRCGDPRSITGQSSRSPVKEREEGFYEQVHQDHDGETCRDNQTKLEGTRESWINGCRTYMGLD
ncbi:hypothetical protein STEG23_027402 [Scotinomys teguina]